MQGPGYLPSAKRLADPQGAHQPGQLTERGHPGKGKVALDFPPDVLPGGAVQKEAVATQTDGEQAEELQAGLGGFNITVVPLDESLTQDVTFVVQYGAPFGRI